MATIAAARSILRSNAARNAGTNLVSATKSKSSGCSFRSTSVNNLLSSPRIFRCPVELSACLETMQPFHTATATALMTSMLSITRHTHAWLIDVCNDDV